MNKTVVFLFDYEKEAMLASLGRDMKRELELAIIDPEWKDVRLRNARRIITLIEMLRSAFHFLA